MLPPRPNRPRPNRQERHRHRVVVGSASERRRRRVGLEGRKPRQAEHGEGGLANVSPRIDNPPLHILIDWSTCSWLVRDRVDRCSREYSPLGSWAEASDRESAHVNLDPFTFCSDTRPGGSVRGSWVSAVAHLITLTEPWVRACTPMQRLHSWRCPA